MSLRVATDRRRGWLAVIAGAGLVLAIQIAAPIGVPLYDGVVVQEPYRYLHPTGDQVGSPTSGSDTEPVAGAESPILVISTTESPAQVQFIAMERAFTMPAGTTSLLGSITPIEPPPPPSGGAIAGNAYRVTVTDQSGNPVGLPTCDACRSLIIRAPDATIDGTIKRYADGVWTDLETTPANLVGFQVEPTVLGDFALIVSGPLAPGDGATDDQSGLSPILVAGVGVVIVLLLIGGLFLFFKIRQAPVSSAPLGRGASRGDLPTRIPSKRKPPRRPPPPGRSK